MLQNPAAVSGRAPLAPRADKATSGDVRLETSGKARLLCIAAEWIINGDEAVEELDVEIMIGMIELGVGLDGVLEIVFIILKFPEVVVPSCPP